MTGYHPDHGFLKKIGVKIDEESGRPYFNEETMETNVEGVFIAGLSLPAIMPMRFLLKTGVSTAD